MAFRELHVIEVKEILRRWADGDSIKSVVRQSSVSRNTVRRYVRSAQRHGLRRGDVEGALDDELVVAVVGDVHPGTRPYGEARAACEEHRTKILAWKKECDAPKIRRLLLRQNVDVPLRTLQRFLNDEAATSLSGHTVRLRDPDPGVLEFDFMELGTFVDRLTGAEIDVSAAVMTAAVSRYQFVWPCLTQTRDDVIDALEAAWSFFGGVFPVVLPDNLKAVVQTPDAVNPRFNTWFFEYAQARGFALDPARIRRPKDKARVERQVPYVRKDFFGGENFGSLQEIRVAATIWCREEAGGRDHGTTSRHPVEHFESVERAVLLPKPEDPYDTPEWSEHTVRRDHAIRVGNALYSVPFSFGTGHVRARLDRSTVKLYGGRKLIKAHVRVPAGESQLDPADAPPGRAAAVERTGESLFVRADDMSSEVGRYARRLAPDPKRMWSDIRRVYRLLHLCDEYGPDATTEACRRALELDVIDIRRIEGMLRKGLERRTPTPRRPRTPRSGKVLQFERDASEFAISPETP